MTPATLPPRFRWLPGMLRLRYAPGMADHLRPEGRVADGRDDWLADGCVPDLNDPATVGALAALVREVYARPFACAFRASVDKWAVAMADGWSHRIFRADTESAAWWAALEAAP